MRYKALLFDFDYTLGDSTQPIVASAQWALEEMGWPPASAEEIRRTVGLTLEDAYTQLTGEKDPARRAQFYTLFRAKARETMVEDTKLLPGAETLLRGLNHRGIALAVVSTKGRHNITEIFRRFGLEQLFSCIVGGEDVSVPKPDPEGLHFVLKQLGLRPEEALFVGDTVIDAETARRAGTEFAAVTTGTTQAAAFAAFPCRHIASGLDALSAWLEEA